MTRNPPMRHCHRYCGCPHAASCCCCSKPCKRTFAVSAQHASLRINQRRLMISNQSIRRGPANGTFCVFPPAAAHRLLALFATLTFVGGHLSFWKPASLILAVFTAQGGLQYCCRAALRGMQPHPLPCVLCGYIVQVCSNCQPRWRGKTVPNS